MATQNQWESPEPGLRRKIFSPGEQLMMMELRLEPEAQVSLHSHPHEQISYCLEGKVEFTVDGKKTVLQAGETLHVPGNAVHGAKALVASALLESFTPLREDLLS